MTTSRTHYIHGSDPDEQQRLDVMNTLINSLCLEQLADIGASRIVDFGSGMGQFTRAMARRAGLGACIVGIERDENQRAKAIALAESEGEARLVDFRAGDVHDPPLRDDEWGTFDLAWTRFVLEHVRRPLEIVDQMARAVRVGGDVILVDDDHEILRLWPEAPEFQRAWEAYLRSYQAIGCDPNIGRKLPQLLARAGLDTLRAATMHYGTCAGDPRFIPLVENLMGVMRTAIGVVREHRLMPTEEYTSAIDSLREWAAQPGAALWYVMHLAHATRRRSS
ncbi:MAG: class I SAM-dependent methyltransferase [Phycisphaerales bacterium JB043]